MMPSPFLFAVKATAFFFVLTLLSPAYQVFSLFSTIVSKILSCRFTSHRDKPTLFQKHLERHGITHKLIRPYTPRHNGKVERSHRKDNERFYATHSFYSFEDFAKQLKQYNTREYNHFPMRPLGWKTPSQVLKEFKQHTVTHD